MGSPGSGHQVASAGCSGAREELGLLRALDVDYVDIWQLHYVNTASDREQVLGRRRPEAALRRASRGHPLHRVTGHDWVEWATWPPGTSTPSSAGTTAP